MYQIMLPSLSINHDILLIGANYWSGARHLIASNQLGFLFYKNQLGSVLIMQIGFLLWSLFSERDWVKVHFLWPLSDLGAKITLVS